MSCIFVFKIQSRREKDTVVGIIDRRLLLVLTPLQNHDSDRFVGISLIHNNRCAILC